MEEGEEWRGRSDMKFRWVIKGLYTRATESEIRESDIWAMALKMAKMMGTVLSNEEVIQVSVML